MLITQGMLNAAMIEAAKVGILPNHPVDTDTYLKYWDGMKKILNAALNAR